MTAFLSVALSGIWAFAGTILLILLFILLVETVLDRVVLMFKHYKSP